MKKDLLNPKNWGLILLFVIARILVLLPYLVLMKIGKFFGLLLYFFMKKRLEIVRINIKLCFPELNAQEQEALVKANMVSYGKAIFEFLLAFLAPDKKIAGLYHTEGSEHLQEALKANKGVILLCAHFTPLELAGRMGSMSIPNMKEKLYVMYRQHKNALLEDFVVTRRSRYAKGLIPKTKVLRMLKILRNNNAIWYAQDQNVNNNMVFAPFFGILASTTTALSRITKITGARVVPFLFYRKTDDSGYGLKAFPALENFPSGDDVVDATKINQLIEGWVKEHPDQYLWIHRRFKVRPPGELPIYPPKKKKGH